MTAAGEDEGGRQGTTHNATRAARKTQIEIEKSLSHSTPIHPGKIYNAEEDNIKEGGKELLDRRRFTPSPVGRCGPHSASSVGVRSEK